MSNKPDYEKLFKQAIFHLRVVSGSRNSFTTEMRDRMFDPKLPRVPLRSPEVERMQHEAYEFLKEHDQ
jgi:hypothetical protein